MKRLVARTVAALSMALLVAPPAWPCPYCRVEVRDRAFGPDFGGTVFFLLLPLLVIAATGIVLYFADRPAGKRNAD